MYRSIHDHFKTILLLILVIYAAINYSDRKCKEQPKQWNELVEQYETTRILNKMGDYLAEHEEQIRYFLDSHPVI